MKRSTNLPAEPSTAHGGGAIAPPPPSHSPKSGLVPLAEWLIILATVWFLTHRDASLHRPTQFKIRSTLGGRVVFEGVFPANTVCLVPEFRTNGFHIEQRNREMTLETLIRSGGL